MRAVAAYALTAFILAILLDVLIIHAWKKKRAPKMGQQSADTGVEKKGILPSPLAIKRLACGFWARVGQMRARLAGLRVHRGTLRGWIKRCVHAARSTYAAVRGWFRGDIQQFHASYHKGKLSIPSEINLPEAGLYRVTVQPEVGSLWRARWQLWVWSTAALLKSSVQALSLEAWLLVLSLGVYLSVRLIALPDFPIYFFCDEANQVNLAADLLRDHWKSPDGEFLPTYFYNVEKYNLSLSVYVQVIPYLLFGKSVFAARAVTVLISLLAALSVAGILGVVLNLRHPWLGVLVLSLMPAWFIHSRTAFETALMVSFYAAGLFFYLLYRCRTPIWLYLSVIMFALAFYSYSPGQLVVVLTGVLFGLFDLRYHWQQRRVLWRAAGLAALLMLPYLRFRLNHPEDLLDHLYTVSSYWVQPLPLWDKVIASGKEYLYGLSPAYWFFPNNRDLMRHVWKGSGHIHVSMLPLWILGLGLLLKKIAAPAHRVILLSFIIAPCGALLAHVSITRVLVMVIPGALIIAIGGNFLLERLPLHGRMTKALSLSAFITLVVASFLMVRTALVAGPTWFQDYGLYGMQYGARQLFSEVKAMLKEQPEAQIILSPTWANSADVLARFFLPEPLPLRMGSIREYFYYHLELTPQTVFIMTPIEYARTLDSGKFDQVEVLRTVQYPNGLPGFYFVRLRYVDHIDQILEKERQERRKLLTAYLPIQGERATVRHSLLDIGEAVHLFDGNERSLARTFEANPFIIEVLFSRPRLLNGLTLIVGDTRVLVSVWVYPPQEETPMEFHYELVGSVSDPMVSFDFESPLTVMKLHLEVKDLSQGEPGHVHLWEIMLR